MRNETSIGTILLLLLVLEAIVIFLIASPERVARIQANELRLTAAATSNEFALAGKRFSEHWFDKHFVSSGIKSFSYDLFIPDEHRRARADMENFLPRVFVWVAERLDGFWATVHGAYIRAYSLGSVLMLLAMIPISLLADGIMGRETMIDRRKPTTPVFYHAAKRIARVLSAAPLFLLFIPITISVHVWSIWVLALSGSAMIGVRHVQEL